MSPRHRPGGHYIGNAFEIPMSIYPLLAILLPSELASENLALISLFLSFYLGPKCSETCGISWMHHAGYTFLCLNSRSSSLLGLSFPGSLPRPFPFILKYLAQNSPLFPVHLNLGRQPPWCLQVPGTHLTQVPGCICLLFHSPYHSTNF